MLQAQPTPNLPNISISTTNVKESEHVDENEPNEINVITLIEQINLPLKMFLIYLYFCCNRRKLVKISFIVC